MSVDRNERAAAMFPADWARMEQMTGKRRSRMRATLRNRATYEDGLAALPALASCATCAHHGRYPTDNRMTCDLDSDFYGYTIVKPDHKCPRWATKDMPQ